MNRGHGWAIQLGGSGVCADSIDRSGADVKSGPALFWLGVYSLLVLAPLVLAFSGTVPASGGFAWDFAMALGFAGVAMVGVQFVLTARFKRLAAPFGIDIVYYVHRYLAVVLLVLVLGHVVIVGWVDPDSVGPLDPRVAPGYMTVGRIALAALLLVTLTSLWRKRLRIEYDVWRHLHAGLAVLALVAAVAHVAGSGHSLDTPFKRIAWLVLALVWLLPFIHVRMLRPLRLLRRPYRIESVQPEHGRAVTITVVPDGHAGFDYRAGQFAWLTVRASPFALREHPFSFSSSPSQPGRLAFTIKALGDFTAGLGDLRPGERAHVDGPYGAFGYGRHPHAPGYGFIAGGVGIAPIISMLHDLADRGDRRPLALIYCNRVWDNVIFREQLDALAVRLDLRVCHVLGEPPEQWTGERGLLDDGIVARHLPEGAARWHYFVCGPTPMIRIAERALSARAVPLRRIHSELFDLA